MKRPPLKRHPALQPFSRDHMAGLMRAQDLIRSARKDRKERTRSIERFLAAWEGEIEEHFDDEERLLPGLMSAAHLERLRKEHAEIRSLAAEVSTDSREEPGEGRASLLGETLVDHIRWEERELFPHIQETATRQALAGLAKETAEFEKGRPRSRQRIESLIRGGSRLEDSGD